MPELLKDATYRRFLEREPHLPEIANDKALQKSPPWIVFIQREVDGPWGKKEFWKYSKALKFLQKGIRLGVHDAALHCRRFSFDPPTRVARIKGKFVTDSQGNQRQVTKPVPWKVKLEPGDAEHRWCRYCRRPTEFRYFRRHRRLNLIDTTIRRCCICGTSTRLT